MNQPASKIGKERHILRLLLVAVLVCCWLLLAVDRLPPVPGGEAFRDWLNRSGSAGLMLVFFGGALVTALGGARQAVAVAFGMALGGWWGTLVSTLAALLGATLTFYISRLLLRPRLQHRYQRQLRRIETALRNHRGWLAILMIRLMPIGNNLVTNLVAGVTRLKLTAFLAGSALGYLPQMLIFAYAGAGLGMRDRSQLALSIVAFVVAMAIGVWLHQSVQCEQMDSL